MGNPLKRTIRGAVAVAVLCLVGLGLAYAVGEAVAPVYRDAKVRAALFAGAAEHITAATLGSSHNLAIDFETLDMEGFHLWWPGGDIFETERSLEEAVRRAPHLRYAFIAAPLYLFDNGAIRSLDGRADIRRRVYTEYGNFEPIAGDWKIALQAAAAPVARPDHWLRVVRAMIGRADSVVVRADGLPRRSTEGRLAAVEVPASALWRSARHLAVSTESLELNPDLCEEAARSYARLATVAHEADVQVVLFTPPYTQPYLDEIRRKGEVCPTRQIVREVALRWDNVVYLDRSDHAEFTTRFELFLDADHLNAQGARVFSRLLREELVQRGMLSEDVQIAAVR